MHPLKGYDADELPVEYKLPARTPLRTIDLSLLRQNPPSEHLVDSGDILGIYIQGVLGDAEQPPPVYVPNSGTEAPSLGYPIRVDTNGSIALPMLDPLPVRGMTLGRVREMIRHAYTQGPQAVLQPGRDHIHVTLQKSRTYQVIVIREEAGNAQGNRGAAAVVNFETDKRGTGRVINLSAHRNDVLNALTQTGGLPGLDAENVIYVIRGRHASADCACQNPHLASQQQSRSSSESPLIQTAAWQSNDRVETSKSLGGHSLRKAHFETTQPNRVTHASHQFNSTAGSLQGRYAGIGLAASPPMTQIPGQQHSLDTSSAVQQVGHPQHIDAHTAALLSKDPHGFAGNRDHQPCEQCLQQFGPNIIRIPLKVLPGDTLPFSPQDVVLNDGDIVLVENRVTEFYYTAGLLGGGQYPIPRDYDIGVMDAIALAELQTRRDLPTSTIGGASVLNQDVSVGASRVIIQRKMPNGSYFPIEVNLYDAIKDPGQQIMIHPEDRLILRYTKCEAMLAFFERFFIDGLVTGTSNSIDVQN